MAVHDSLLKFILMLVVGAEHEFLGTAVALFLEIHEQTGIGEIEWM